MFCEFDYKIFDIAPTAFDAWALENYQFQYAHNAVYRLYADSLYTNSQKPGLADQLPFLPISFFKTHDIRAGQFEPDLLFESSGTTGMIPSRHWVKDKHIYTESFIKGFDLFYGDPSAYCILGLLPSYLERQHSSLVYMVDELIRRSGHPMSGFFLHDLEELGQRLRTLEKQGQKSLLIGVTFGLLDFAAQFPLPLQHCIVMETGGMKGRRTEMTRQEVHAELKQAFSLEAVHSEYGMTELLSQAYASADGRFRCPPWMRVLIRAEDDPLDVKGREAISEGGVLEGLINIIDLANFYSCSFIATDDIGRLYPDGSFEVLGRADNSDLRGCSLMLAGT